MVGCLKGGASGLNKGEGLGGVFEAGLDLDAACGINGQWANGMNCFGDVFGRQSAREDERRLVGAANVFSCKRPIGGLTGSAKASGLLGVEQHQIRAALWRRTPIEILEHRGEAVGADTKCSYDGTRGQCNP